MKTQLIGLIAFMLVAQTGSALAQGSACTQNNIAQQPKSMVTAVKTAIKKDLIASGLEYKACVMGKKVTQGLNVGVSALAESLPVTGDVLLGLDYLFGPKDHARFISEDNKEMENPIGRSIFGKTIINAVGVPIVAGYSIAMERVVDFATGDTWDWKNSGAKTAIDDGYSKTKRDYQKLVSHDDKCPKEFAKYQAAREQFHLMASAK